MDKIYQINSSIDIELASYHNFIKDGELLNDYIILQKKYYLLLERLLDNILMLKKIEQEINNSGYFISCKEKITNKINIKNVGLNYFFIRNNLNIETLSFEEMNILKKSNNSSELFQLVNNTFLKVIKVSSLCGKKIPDSKILYDGTSLDSLKDNDSLVLGFLYDLSEAEVSDEIWEQNVYKREDIKEKILKYITYNAYNKLNCKIEFIDYLN